MGRHDEDQKHAEQCVVCGKWYDPYFEGERGKCNTCYNREIAKHDMKNGYDEVNHASYAPSHS
jgi:hypothetical protein